AKFSGAASIASLGEAWKVGSGLIVIGNPPAVGRGAGRPRRVRFASGREPRRSFSRHGFAGRASNRRGAAVATDASAPFSKFDEGPAQPAEESRAPRRPEDRDSVLLRGPLREAAVGIRELSVSRRLGGVNRRLLAPAPASIGAVRARGSVRRWRN